MLFEPISPTHKEISSPQFDREKLVGASALRIRQSLDLDSIMSQTVEEVRLFLQADRVLIYRFEPDWSGLIVAESVIAPWKAVFGYNLKDPCFTEKHIEQYKQGRIQILENIETANLSNCHLNLLAGFDVKANLVVPIIAEEKLWGLLIAQHCQRPHKWDTSEIELLKQLANQVGIAVQQAELYEKVQSFNTYLEQKVKARTAKLQRALQFEALMRRVTERVRDSLDEAQILQKVTQELAEVLNIEHCKIGLYDRDRNTETIAYEYTNTEPYCQGLVRNTSNFPELYQQLLHKHSLQFVERIPRLSPLNNQINFLVCPIFDNQGILGNFWLLRPKEELFDEFEMSLVEQVASQCAIAIRQARLYKAAQNQVKELEKLNVLKDDFLKTISHELRTPMSSIMLASQTLEKLIETQGIHVIKSNKFQRVFQIFKNSCQQQNKLVHDLLTLCYVEAENAALIPELIDLRVLIPRLVEPFRDRIEEQQQLLIVDIPQEIPLLNSDISLLERTFNELLNNACKYTPPEETISVTAKEDKEKILLNVSNSGVEIPLEEQEFIFEKFYRIPSHDPWKYGGTGIGLALVKKLVSILGAAIRLESQAGQTTFTIEFALN